MYVLSFVIASISQSLIVPSTYLSPSVSVKKCSSPVPISNTKVAVVRCRKVFCRLINSAIPLRLIAVLRKGISLNSAVVELAYSSGGSPIRAVIRPSKTVSLCSSVVTTFKALVHSTSPSAIVCDKEWGDNSSSALSAPIRCSKCLVARE